eukprot:scaffold94615_cov60-Phaeocystis_antarctica.AAC.3
MGEPPARRAGARDCLPRGRRSGLVFERGASRSRSATWPRAFALQGSLLVVMDNLWCGGCGPKR